LVEIIHHKTCGILGGMGPFATAYFFLNILNNTPAKKDWDHIHILIDNNIYIPSRTRAILYNEESPVTGMIDSINKLASIGADFIVVPCNSAYYFYQEVQSRIDVEWLNMPEIVTQKVFESNCLRPLVIGGYITTTKKIYDKFIKDIFYLEPKQNRFFESIIEELKLTSSISAESKSGILKIIQKNQQHFDSIILACTEYSLIADVFEKSGLPVFDSNKLYAQETVSFAKR
jgi:aspartate racemase